jgi:hypothetical protein
MSANERASAFEAALKTKVQQRASHLYILAKNFIFWTDRFFIDKNSQGKLPISIMNLAATQYGSLTHIVGARIEW